MLIVRAPMRISFAGGGTDLAEYYEPHGGFVVSAAINKFFYAMIEIGGHEDIQISSSDYGTFYQHRSAQPLFCEGDLALPKAVVQQFGLVRGAKIFLASEVPPGTGLGSSSSVAVALVKGLATLTGRRLTALQTAEMAFSIETEKLGMPIGAQDHYAAAYGGANVIEFGPDRIEVRPLMLSSDTTAELESRLLLFFTQSSRVSSDILRSQQRDTAAGHKPVLTALHGIKALAREARDLLEAGEVDAFGELLHESWQLKKSLSSRISTQAIDEHYEVARQWGAIGGKITGAGGGGFLMLLVRDGSQRAVTRVLEERGLYHMEYRLEASGAQVLMNSGLEISSKMLAAGLAA